MVRSVGEKEGVKIRRVGIGSLFRGGRSVKMRVLGWASVREVSGGGYYGGLGRLIILILWNSP